MIFIKTFLFNLVLIALHELGHILCAKILKLKVLKLNLKLVPFPHASVAIENEQGDQVKRNWFLIAGSLCSVTLFFIANAVGMLEVDFIKLAFKIQLMLETNPFFSDITIFFNKRRSKSIDEFYKTYNQNQYSFTPLWYVHLLIWTLLIVSLFKN